MPRQAAAPTKAKIEKKMTRHPVAGPDERGREEMG
jgi:hypothetical protein